MPAPGRGVGFGLSIIPAMTAAYRALPPDKIPDATPQLNVLRRAHASKLEEAVDTGH